MDAQNRWWVSGWLAADLACLHLDLATMRRWCNWRQDNKKTWRTGEKKKSTRSLSVEWLPVQTEEQVHFTKSQHQQLRSGGVQVLERKTGGRCKAHDKVRRTEERAGEAMAVRYTWKNKRSTLVEEEASPLARCPTMEEAEIFFGRQEGLCWWQASARTEENKRKTAWRSDGWLDERTGRRTEEWKD